MTNVWKRDNIAESFQFLNGFNLPPNNDWTAPDDDTYYVVFDSLDVGNYVIGAQWLVDRDYCPCGPSILDPIFQSCGLDAPVKCCDRVTGAVGPACCGNIPYDDKVSTCCEVDSSVVSGTGATCVPSTQPSSVPSTEPTPFSTSQPTELTCDMVDPCDYDLEDDGTGGVNILETYYPVCIEDRRNTYRQGCYPSSQVLGLGVDDQVPGLRRGGKIVNCGCCPSEDMLPEGIRRVRGPTLAVCEGALDCLAEGYTPSSVLSEDVDDVLFDVCIDDTTVVQKELFYVPSNEVANCGPCETI